MFFGDSIIYVFQSALQRNHRPNDPADVYQYDGLYQLVQVWYGADATEPGSITNYNTLQDYDLDQMGNRLAVTEYIYDARGRRVARVQDSSTTHFIYDTSYRVIEERNNSETLVAAYTYGQGMDEPLTMERDSQTYYYHRDPPSTGSGQAWAASPRSATAAAALSSGMSMMSMAKSPSLMAATSPRQLQPLTTPTSSLPADSTPKAATTITGHGSTALNSAVSSVWTPWALTAATTICTATP